VSYLFHDWVKLKGHRSKVCERLLPLLSPSSWFSSKTIEIGGCGLFAFSEEFASVVVFACYVVVSVLD